VIGRVSLIAFLIVSSSVLTAAQTTPGQTPRPGNVATTSGGIIRGVVTTQTATIPLGGVLVSLTSTRTNQVRTVISEGDGSYRFDGLEAGDYRVSASIDGFDPKAIDVKVTYNQTVDAPLDLLLGGIAERVDVIAPQTVVPSTGALTPGDVVGSRELEQLSAGGGFQAALRLLASVIEVPGGVAIKGGRPSQAAVQLGAGSFVDPATGLSQVRLPDDAIDSVTVLPNPYAVEFGRFSSGLVLIQTRRAGDQWRTRLNNLDPTFRTVRGSAFDVTGIASFSPRIETGGPLIKDKLFIQQAAQYRYRASDVPSLRPDELRRSQSFSSFTRADANLSPKHTLTALAGFFPNVTKNANLGTFTPPGATVDLHGGVNTAAVTERTLWNDSLFSETTVEVNQYRTDAYPQGGLPMQLLAVDPYTAGNFFNRQNRSTMTYQLVESVSGSKRQGSVLHLFKAGIDVLHARLTGQSASSPVLIDRADGVLVRRLDFGAPTTQGFDSTDLALFAQDRIQPTNRWYVEFGARLDRDGVIERFNLTPRLGSALLFNDSGTAVLRAGIGLFYERTPSAAGAFTQYESATDTRYNPADPTAAPQSRLFQHTIDPNLRTPRSLTWDLAYDYRFNPRWALHLGVIDRRGDNELLVEPIVTDATAALRLDSFGHSRYREAEVGIHFTTARAIDLNVTYVRSRALADTNAFTSYFDSVEWPIVGQNAYAPARADAPHRMLLRSRVLPRPTWLLIAVVDWRSGLPYSTTNESLDFVGPRNQLRFPTYIRTELGIEHRVRIKKFRPWIGIRVDNALNAWLPSDVQANLTSPAFGTFYNSEYRQARIQLRFER
jgi:outer membrane receptor for ferrienterochelin and colicin